MNAPGPSRAVLVLGGAAVLAIGVLAFLAYGTGSTGGTPAAQVRAWASSTGLGNAVGLLVSDNRIVAATLAHGGSTGAVHADCALMVTDAQAANGSLPSPDQRLTGLLSAAYGQEGSAGSDCYTAGSTNRALLVRSARERAAAETLLDRALERVRVVSGTSVPTTTTTGAGGGGIFG